MEKTLWIPTLKLWMLGIAQMPIIFYFRPRIVSLDKDKIIVRIPYSRRVKNTFKSMHFSAMCTGADLAGSVLSYFRIQDQGGRCQMTFKDFHANFLKRCEGDAYFSCNDGEIIREGIERAIATKERQNVNLKIYAKSPTTSTGEAIVAEFQMTLSLKAKD